jgi:hypothetical protein
MTALQSGYSTASGKHFCAYRFKQWAPPPPPHTHTHFHLCDSEAESLITAQKWIAFLSTQVLASAVGASALPPLLPCPDASLRGSTLQLTSALTTVPATMCLGTLPFGSSQVYHQVVHPVRVFC